MKAPDNMHWTLDKRIPLAMVLTIMVQTSAGVWWASNITTQVSYNVSEIKQHEGRIESMRSDAIQLGRTNVRLIEQIENMRLGMADFKQVQVETNNILRQLLQQRVTE